MPPVCVRSAHIQGAFYQLLYHRLEQFTLTVDHLSLIYPYAFGNWNELFKETTKLNTGFSGVVCLESTLKYP